MNKLHLKIGTSSSNELVLEEVGIDPHHLELFCDEYGNVFITDLKSTNGTFVNDQALDGFKLLVAGDKVRFGKTYIFDWENLILSPNSVTKQLDVVASLESEKTQIAIPIETPISNNEDLSKINKELFIVYGVIFVLLILLYTIL
jgi:pSer/pThr/pTyr-binding forkhead associated (FHA) protein